MCRPHQVGLSYLDNWFLSHSHTRHHSLDSPTSRGHMGLGHALERCPSTTHRQRGGPYLQTGVCTQNMHNTHFNTRQSRAQGPATGGPTEAETQTCVTPSTRHSLFQKCVLCPFPPSHTAAHPITGDYWERERSRG